VIAYEAPLTNLIVAALSPTALQKLQHADDERENRDSQSNILHRRELPGHERRNLALPPGAFNTAASDGADKQARWNR